MKRRAWLLCGVVLSLAALGCTGVPVGVSVYGRPYPGYYYGRGPFLGYGDRVVVVDPCRGGGCGGGGIDPPGGPPEAVPLPEPPPGMPDFPDVDMGMPDMGGMDMDVGGFDF